MNILLKGKNMKKKKYTTEEVTARDNARYAVFMRTGKWLKDDELLRLGAEIFFDEAMEQLKDKYVLSDDGYVTRRENGK